jgi:hypothetical protein
LILLSAALTHPDYASLVDPLFCYAEKRVKKAFFFNPLSAAGEERVAGAAMTGLVK